MTSMATVSANTLFHFTGDIKNLLGILTNNFYPRYCLEDHSAFFPTLDKKLTEKAIPMVCFCDIPLSSIRNHIEVYGRYAIGLKKEWGVKNQICPIMYYCENSISVEMISHFFDSIYRQIDESKGYLARAENQDEPSDGTNMIQSNSWELAGIHNGLIRITGFTKQYSGTVSKNGKEIDNVRFYDEREWRYVPDFISHPQLFPPPISRNDFANKKNEANKKLETDETTLKFTPSDIKYIILSKEEEILPIIEKIEAIKSQKFSTDDVELLKTRIISMEQILQDF